MLDFRLPVKGQREPLAGKEAREDGVSSKETRQTTTETDSLNSVLAFSKQTSHVDLYLQFNETQQNLLYHSLKVLGYLHPS